MTETTTAKGSAGKALEKNGRSCRTVEVARNLNGEPLGIAIFLNTRQLTEVGINPETTDRVQFYVDNGRIKVTDSETAQESLNKHS